MVAFISIRSAFNIGKAIQFCFKTIQQLQCFVVVQTITAIEGGQMSFHTVYDMTA